MQHIAVFDLIGFALDAELASLFRARFTLASDIVVIGDGLGTDKALFKVAVDHTCGARGKPA